MPVKHSPSRARDILALVEGGMQLEAAGVTQPAVAQELGVAEATYRRGKALLVAANAGDELAIQLVAQVAQGDVSYTGAYMMLRKRQSLDKPTVASMLAQDPPPYSRNIMDHLRRIKWDADHGDALALWGVAAINDGVGISTVYDQVYAGGRKADTPHRPPRASDALTSVAGRKRAEVRRDRVNDAVASLDGYSTGLSDLDLTEVMKVTDPAVVQAWANTARRTARALQKFAATLPSNNHKGDV